MVNLALVWPLCAFVPFSWGMITPTWQVCHEKEKGWPRRALEITGSGTFSVNGERKREGGAWRACTLQSAGTEPATQRALNTHMHSIPACTQYPHCCCSPDHSYTPMPCSLTWNCSQLWQVSLSLGLRDFAQAAPLFFSLG